MPHTFGHRRPAFLSSLSFYCSSSHYGFFCHRSPVWDLPCAYALLLSPGLFLLPCLTDKVLPILSGLFSMLSLPGLFSVLCLPCLFPEAISCCLADKFTLPYSLLTVLESFLIYLAVGKGSQGRRG